jgi:hypothetical protein
MNMKHVVTIHFRTAINDDKKIAIVPVDGFKGRVTFDATQQPGTNALLLEYRGLSVKDIAEIVNFYVRKHGHDTFEIVYSMDTKVDEL